MGTQGTHRIKAVTAASQSPSLCSFWDLAVKECGSQQTQQYLSLPAICKEGCFPASSAPIRTGDQYLDRLISGGISPGSITEIVGQR